MFFPNTISKIVQVLFFFLNLYSVSSKMFTQMSFVKKSRSLKKKNVRMKNASSFGTIVFEIMVRIVN